jgi:hypothetical protein
MGVAGIGVCNLVVLYGMEKMKSFIVFEHENESPPPFANVSSYEGI